MAQVIEPGSPRELYAAWSPAGDRLAIAVAPVLPGLQPALLVWDTSGGTVTLWPSSLWGCGWPSWYGNEGVVVEGIRETEGLNTYYAPLTTDPPPPGLGFSASATVWAGGPSGCVVYWDISGRVWVRFAAQEPLVQSGRIDKVSLASEGPAWDLTGTQVAFFVLGESELDRVACVSSGEGQDLVPVKARAFVCDLRWTEAGALAVLTSTTQIVTYNVASGTLAPLATPQVPDLMEGQRLRDRLSADGRLLLTWDPRRGAYRLWDTGRARFVATLGCPKGLRALLAPDGSRVAVLSGEGVALFDRRGRQKGSWTWGNLLGRANEGQALISLTNRGPVPDASARAATGGPGSTGRRVSPRPSRGRFFSTASAFMAGAALATAVFALARVLRRKRA